MALLDLFIKRDAKSFGRPVPPEIDLAYAERILNMDANTLRLHTELPRGVDMLRRKQNRGTR